MRPIRLACWHCDTENGDGITKAEAKDLGWKDIVKARESKSWSSQWWTHLGICPGCVYEGHETEAMASERDQGLFQ